MLGIGRLKDVAQEKYTQEEAERGAGMTREKYPPAHPVRSGLAGGEAADVDTAAADDMDPDL